MGPSTSVDGEVEALITRLLARQLQWGRRQASTERRPARVGTAFGAALQWGRRQASTERTRRAKLEWQVLPLQWGRRQASTERFISKLSR